MIRLRREREMILRSRRLLNCGSRPLKLIVRQHAVATIWRKVQSGSKIALWLSWATLAWALLSYVSFQTPMRLPHAVELLGMLSGGISLVGGCLACLYLLVGARSTPFVISALVAAAANFCYCWMFIDSLVGHPT